MSEGAGAFTTNRIAQMAGIPVGSVYRYFPDKEAIVQALAVSYWSDFEDLVAAAADADELDPLPDPGAVVLDALAAGFRARPGFLALWYGGLRTEEVRDATRPTRSAIARSIERILSVHWPAARTTSARHAPRWSCSPATGSCVRRSGVDPAGRRAGAGGEQADARRVHRRPVGSGDAVAGCSCVRAAESTRVIGIERVGPVLRRSQTPAEKSAWRSMRGDDFGAVERWAGCRPRNQRPHRPPLAGSPRNPRARPAAHRHRARDTGLSPATRPILRC